MAIREKTVVVTRLSAECPSHARSNVTARDTGMIVDEPEARGGTNAGPSPTETAVAALVGCTNVIGHKCAASLDVDIGHLTIDAAFELDRRGVLLQEEVETPFRSVTLTIVSDGPCSEEDLARVAEKTARHCAVSKLFRGAGTEITEIWKKA